MRERLSVNKIDIRNRDYLVYKPLFKDLSDAVSNYAKGKLLDIGCGNKPYHDLVMNYCDEHIGCDIEQSHLQKVDVICPATAIPLEDETFDSILCTQVLEHVAEHGKVFSEANRLLKSSGYFIASLPMYWPHHEEPYDFFRFTKHGIHHLLEKNNFEIVLIKPNGGKWALVGQSLILALYSDNSPTGYTQFKRIFRKIFFPKIIINYLFSFFDRISKDEVDTMNFVFVGKKLRSN